MISFAGGTYYHCKESRQPCVLKTGLRCRKRTLRRPRQRRIEPEIRKRAFCKCTGRNHRPYPIHAFSSSGLTICSSRAFASFSCFLVFQLALEGNAHTWYASQSAIERTSISLSPTRRKAVRQDYDHPNNIPLCFASIISVATASRLVKYLSCLLQW